MLAIAAPGQGSQTPGMLSPWLELPGAREVMEGFSEASGLDLIRLGTTADADEIKDTAVTQPLIVALSLLAANELELGEGTVIAGHSVGELAAAADRRFADADRGGGLRRTPRSGDGRRLRADPYWHVRGARRRPQRGSRPDRPERPHCCEPQRRRPGRRRRRGGRTGRTRRQSAGQRPGAAAAGGRRVPHPLHEPGRGRAGRLRPEPDRAQPAPRSCCRTPTAPRSAPATACSVASFARSPARCAGTCARNPCASSASPH